ncbi:accessory Sec system glycosyltransferase Asp1, partial [Staphylococcus capitis]|uniref:accessory Sec system glycosyltransferase Asp1 n=1 Tax=Staphylococcus capitis TaxID=29388 RepID=UPI00119DA3FA
QNRQYTDFHDMISLITMHTKNNLHYQFIILTFTPYLTTFLHTYHFFQTNYSSVFHDIQPVTHQTPHSIHYPDLPS